MGLQDTNSEQAGPRNFCLQSGERTGLLQAAVPKGDEGQRRGQGDPSKTNQDPKGLALPSHTAALHPIRALKGGYGSSYLPTLT